ncbi:MAG: hypothetical protein ABDH18_02025 [Aquificaceae bacterium]
MISGYLRSQQDLVDLINGYLSNKAGILTLFYGVNTVTIRVEQGFITGFRFDETEEIDESSVNKRAVLLYHLSELLNSPESFFTFKEISDTHLISVEESIHAEEVMLQTQLAHKEIQGLMEQVISPFAIVKVIKGFEDASFYDGRTIYQIIAMSKRQLIDEVRRIKELFSGGFLDIQEFKNLDAIRTDEVSYLMNDVDIKKVNIISLLQGFNTSKFTGAVLVKGGDFDLNLYYKKGKLVAVYPYNGDIFGFLMGQSGGASLSVLSLEERTMELYMLRHSENKMVRGIPGSFIELGKVLMSMNVERRTGLILVYADGGKNYIMHKDGAVVSVLQEKAGQLKKLNSFSFKKVDGLELVFYESMENIKHIIQLFVVNVIYGVLLRHAGYSHQSILSQLASSDLYKYHEGSIVYRRMPSHEDDLSGFMQFLLDLSYNLLGQQKLEEDLQIVLQPYREVLKVMDLEDYLVAIET